MINYHGNLNKQYYRDDRKIVTEHRLHLPLQHGWD